MLWRVYFEMFHGTFLLFHVHIKRFSVISVRRMLRIREQVMLWRVYFEMFHGTFLLFHVHIEWFSVISVRRLLRIREQVMLWRVYFEMFHGTFLLFHVHIERFSVISVRRFILLLLLRRFIPTCPQNSYRVPATKPLANSHSFNGNTILFLFYFFFWDFHICLFCKRGFVLVGSQIVLLILPGWPLSSSSKIEQCLVADPY